MGRGESRSDTGTVRGPGGSKAWSTDRNLPAQPRSLLIRVFLSQIRAINASTPPGNRGEPFKFAFRTLSRSRLEAFQETAFRLQRSRAVARLDA